MMRTLAGADAIAGSRGWIPHLSARVRSGSKALSYLGLGQAAAPPPIPKARTRFGLFYARPERQCWRAFWDLPRERPPPIPVFLALYDLSVFRFYLYASRACARPPHVTVRVCG